MKINLQDTAPKAVIYTRVSREQQSENTSLAGQFEACKRKAQELGATVVNLFEETKRMERRATLDLWRTRVTLPELSPLRRDGSGPNSAAFGLALPKPDADESRNGCELLNEQDGYWRRKQAKRRRR